MSSGGKSWPTQTAARIEAFESRRLFSSLSLVSPSDTSAIAFTGADRSTLIYYTFGDDYKLSARAPDGTVTHLPMTADTQSFTYGRGSVWFTPRGTGAEQPGEHAIARSDGTVRGTRYVDIESPSDRINQILNLDGQVMIDGFSFGPYAGGQLKQEYAYDASRDDFRKVNVDAMAHDTGSKDYVVPVAAGKVDGRRLYFNDRSRTLYELTMPKTGRPTYNPVIHLPGNTGDDKRAIGWAFLDGTFYYTTGTVDDFGEVTPTATWRTDGTAAGTVTIAGGTPKFDPTSGNPVTVSGKNYVIDGTQLLEFDAKSAAFTSVATISNNSTRHLTSAGDRLYFVADDALYTMKPQDGTPPRQISLNGGHVENDLLAMSDGTHYVNVVFDADFKHRSILLTEGKSATDRVVNFPPRSGDTTNSLIDLRAIAGNGDLLAVTTSNQGSGFYRVSLGSASHAPTAVISNKPSVSEGGTLALDASGSKDADGDTLSYAWDLDDDGNFDDLTTTDARASVSWSQLKKLDHGDGPDTFHIRVRVSDLEHATVSASVLVKLKDSPPSLSVTQPKQVRVDTPAEIKLAFVDAGNDAVTSATVDWGDGHRDVVTIIKGAAIVPHTYASTGTFKTTVESSDEDGTRQSYAGSIEAVRNFSGPALIGSISDQFDLRYNALAFHDGTFLYERPRAGDGSDLVVRTPDGAPERVLLSDRHLIDFQLVGSHALIVVNQSLGGVGQEEYYWTDGTRKHTTKIADADYGDSDAPVITNRGAYYLRGNGRVQSIDLDSLAVTTVRTASREYPTAGTLVDWRDDTYFLGRTPKTNNVLTLWRLDGTTAVSVRSLPEITTSATLSVAGDRLMITSRNYEGSFNKSFDLLSDGTGKGTVAIKAFGGSKDGTTYEDGDNFDLARLYTVHSGSKNELWSLNTKSAAASKLRTFVRTNDQAIETIGQAGKYVYFTADDGTHGEQMWRTDGTSAGTIAMGVAFPSDPSDSFIAAGKSAYFIGKPLGKKTSSGLWVTDGTPGHTRLVKAGSTDLSSATSLIAADGGITFTTLRSDVIDVWSVKADADKATHVATIDANPLADGHFSFPAAIRSGDVWYVTTHAYAKSKNRDYLWVVYA